MCKAVYSRDKYGNIWKHYDSELFPDQRRKVMFTPEMADALPRPIKFKRDHFNQPKEEI